MGITYGGAIESTEVDFQGWTDSNWAEDVDDSRSTASYVFLLFHGPVSWVSRKQENVALSTCEAEYIAQSITATEAVFLRRLLKEIGHSERASTLIWADNQGAIALAENPVQHKRTKHIRTKYYNTRELINRKEIRLEYLPTHQMLADGLTKALTPVKHARFLALMGVE